MTLPKTTWTPRPQLYNGPEETCIRALLLMESAYPRALSAAEMSVFDHAVVHTADFGGPDSLHAPLPGRGGEIGVRGKLVAAALALGHELGLLDEISERDVVRYRAGDDLPSNLRTFLGPYGTSLRARARWLFERFDGGSPSGQAELSGLIAERDLRLLAEAEPDDPQRIRSFALLDVVYASDIDRMDSLAHAAETMSIWRFLRRRTELRRAGDPAAKTMRHAIEPEMLALRAAALAEQGKVERDRHALAAMLGDLRLKAAS